MCKVNGLVYVNMSFITLFIYPPCAYFLVLGVNRHFVDAGAHDGWRFESYRLFMIPVVVGKTSAS